MTTIIIQIIQTSVHVEEYHWIIEASIPNENQWESQQLHGAPLHSNESRQIKCLTF